MSNLTLSWPLNLNRPLLEQSKSSNSADVIEWNQSSRAISYFKAHLCTHLWAGWLTENLFIRLLATQLAEPSNRNIQLFILKTPTCWEHTNYFHQLLLKHTAWLALLCASVCYSNRKLIR